MGRAYSLHHAWAEAKEMGTIKSRLILRLDALRGLAVHQKAQQHRQMVRRRSALGVGAGHRSQVQLFDRLHHESR